MDASTPLVERKQNNRVSPLPQKKQAGNVREHLCYIAPPAQRILEKRARGVRTSDRKNGHGCGRDYVREKRRCAQSSRDLSTELLGAGFCTRGMLLVIALKWSPARRGWYACVRPGCVSAFVHPYIAPRFFVQPEGADLSCLGGNDRLSGG